MATRLSARNLTRRRLGLGTLAIGLSAAVGANAARSEPTAFARWAASPDFDALVQSYLKGSPAPGLSVAVIDGGEIVRTAAYGLADVAARRRMTPDTVVQIASVTKVITATAVMQLVEAGRIDLDAPVDTYVGFAVRNPAFPGDAITTRQLLTHTSSIADGPAYGASYVCGTFDVPLRAWIASYLLPDGARYDPAENFSPRRPGALHGYSNVAFGLLGVLVEAASGQSFAGYCQDRLFAPLGMRRSRIGLPPGGRAADATPYLITAPADPVEARLVATGQSAARPQALCDYSFATPPDGQARTTANDLARLLRAYLQDGVGPGRRILAASTISQILSDQHVPRARPSQQAQGLGWRRRDGAWGHTGGDPGVSSAVALVLAQRRGVVVLANTGGDRASLTEQILQRS